MKLVDGQQMHFMEMFENFVASEGQIKEELYLGDKLHLNLDGYRLWDNLWNSTFFNLLD